MPRIKDQDSLLVQHASSLLMVDRVKLISQGTFSTQHLKLVKSLFMEDAEEMTITSAPLMTARKSAKVGITKFKKVNSILE